MGLDGPRCHQAVAGVDATLRHRTAGYMYNSVVTPFLFSGVVLGGAVHVQYGSCVR